MYTLEDWINVLYTKLQGTECSLFCWSTVTGEIHTAGRDHHRSTSFSPSTSTYYSINTINFICFLFVFPQAQNADHFLPPATCSNSQILFFIICQWYPVIYGNNKEHGSYSTNRWLEKPHYSPTGNIKELLWVHK